ncbi:ADP-ribosylglycohydrolase family protein [Mesorhizobium sp.]|uniref:ADP-ribosylglycohydrolase family protein n=1 Tax=Mesorhizobium sp. TaxID=1871066 RepID=UPI0025B8FE9F|nr:ADP-ribosylglycohydrolase family protein [Mesorhizobium sp.]
MDTAEAIDRAMGALIGGALGDALGMPTQLLSPARIAELYGHVEDFVAPVADHPVSKGLAAGTVTDDTEQALLLGRILVVSGNGFDHTRWVNALLDWEREVKARGSYDLLGPSTKRAIDAINDGVPAEEAGRSGDTNGAAMRIAPVGIMMQPEPLDALVAKVAETCRATHNTSIAIASAAAVAAAVSRGVAGGDWRAGTAVTEAIRLIVDLVGTGVASQESIPAAFAVLEIAGGDPWRAAVISANLGGDTDTIGAIAAGMAGACAGFSRLPQEHINRLKGLDIAQVRGLAADLVAARMAKSSSGKDAAA